MEKIINTKSKENLLELGGSMPYFTKELEEEIRKLWKSWKI